MRLHHRLCPEWLELDLVGGLNYNWEERGRDVKPSRKSPD